MRVTIIGVGAVGAGLGHAWLARGHDVRWGVRDPGKPREKLPPERLAAPVDAIRGADAIVLATPWAETERAVRALGNLAGTVLIDATNPIARGLEGPELALGFDTSGAEQVAGWAAGARVVKTLNQTGAENMADAGRYERAPAMFVAGDDAQANALASQLVRDLGFDVLDAGPLRNARLLEPLAMVWIDQAFRRGLGREFSFGIDRPRGGAVRDRAAGRS